MARTAPMWPFIAAGVGLVGVLAAFGMLAASAATAAGGTAALSGEAAAIVGAYGIAPRLAIEIVNTAKAIGTHPYWLADLIRHESAGTFSPSIRNPAPGATATGLIQITEPTAAKLGTTTKKLAAMSAVEQMAWNRYYLEWTAAGLHPDDPVAVAPDTPQRLFMSVFFPPARNVAPDLPFADIDHPYADRVTPNNPGIVTPGDYVSKVLAKGKLSGLVPSRSVA